MKKKKKKIGDNFDSSLRNWCSWQILETEAQIT
jgi:hypothetical protein